jgi:hypothetical protein
MLRILVLGLAAVACAGCFTPLQEIDWPLLARDGGAHPQPDGGACPAQCAADQQCIAGACVTCGCGTKSCGTDACGNSCGACTGVGTTCDVLGHCVNAGCIPTCSGMMPTCDAATRICQCTAGSCGTGQFCVQGVCQTGCPAGQKCASACCGTNQACVSGVCVTCACGGRECGTDDCGNACGACTFPKTCNASGKCITTCQPPCSGTVPVCDTVSMTCRCSATSCNTGSVCTQIGVCQACSSGCCPKTCAEQGIACGKAGDGCGSELNCGSCTPPQTCGANGQCG